MEIVKSRVQSTLVDDAVLELVASRVNKSSGDARLALDLCSNIVGHVWRNTSADAQYPDKPVVRLPQALQALNETTRKMTNTVNTASNMLDL